MRTCFDSKCMAKRHKQDQPSSPLAPFTVGSQRFFRCPECRSAFWWDGPSILLPKDPQRKRTFTDRLIQLTDEQIIRVGHLL